MPIYIYECEKCKKTKELFCRMVEGDEPKDCDCGKKMHKVISAAGVYIPPQHRAVL